MRVLILGGDGMLGHRLLRQFSLRHETRATLRQPLDAYQQFRLFDRSNAYDSVNVLDPTRILQVFAEFEPEAAINTAGIVKQRSDAKNEVLSIEVNALFPHLLARICRKHGTRLVHLSTDCVFSGKKGNYSEEDRPDPEDVYDLSKLLGEAEGPGVMTLRTSMIGPELQRKTGLVEWFLTQKGKTIQGWRKAIFSGLTTAELARVIEKLVTMHPDADGVYHVSSAPISKFDLLTRLNLRLKMGTAIAPDESFKCDRSLDSTRFRAAFGYSPPAWDVMLDELAADILKGSR